MDAAMNNAVKFGTLLKKIHVICYPYEIVTVDNFDSIYHEISNTMDRQGYIYPPIVREKWNQRKSFGVHEEKIGPEKEADLFKTESTHILMRHNGSITDEIKKTDGTFLLGILGIVYDGIYQFEGWWHIDRASVQPRPIADIRNGEVEKWGDDVYTAKDELSDMFAVAFDKWKVLGLQQKRFLLNAIYFHLRACIHRWPYEAFFADYISIDALWKLGEELNLWSPKYKRKNKNKKLRHHERLFVMTDKLGMYFPDSYFNGRKFDFKYNLGRCKEIKLISKTRNYFFHEADFGNGNPLDIGYNNLVTIKIHEFVKRLLMAILGISNNWTRSSWYVMGNVTWN
jgi:hypothetical protein